tara:strand:- start:127 stop:522 length:396 start_codon:yes stop_codon:yes gene_type:complete
MLVLQSCVEPPSYDDGLLENIPAIVNELDYFSLSIFGDDYTEKKEWDLLMNPDSSKSLLTTIVIKDINISSSDSTLLHLINNLGDTVLNAYINSEIIFTSVDTVSNIGVPDRIVFDGNKFTGRLEYQIIVN